MVRDDFICLWTHGASIAELSLMDVYQETLKREYGVEIEPPIFFFNRIKAKIEGQGEGTLLMQELVKIFDEKGITVVNTLNPYGSMDLEALIEFYKKYGFESIIEYLMIRRPNAPGVSSVHQV